MIGDRDKIAELKAGAAVALLFAVAVLIIAAAGDRRRARSRQDERYCDVLAALFDAEAQRDAAVHELQRRRTFQAPEHGPAEEVSPE